MLPSVQKLVPRRMFLQVTIVLYFSKISLDVPCTSDQPEQFSIHDFIQ